MKWRRQRPGGVPEGQWVWFGAAGHHICARMCRFHLHTRVGMYRVSTVGDYWHRDEQHDVGLDRLYETYVFALGGECTQCDPPCRQGEVADWGEIDSLPANDPVEAEANHIQLCRKYAAIDLQEAAA